MGKDKKKITRWWFDRRFYILILVRATEAKTSHLKSVWKKKNKRTKKKRFKQRWNKGDTHITNLGSTLPRKSLVQISSSRILLENSEFVNEQDNIDRNQPGKKCYYQGSGFCRKKKETWPDQPWPWNSRRQNSKTFHISSRYGLQSTNCILHQKSLRNFLKQRKYHFRKWFALILCWPY